MQMLLPMIACRAVLELNLSFVRNVIYLCWFLFLEEREFFWFSQQVAAHLRFLLWSTDLDLCITLHNERWRIVPTKHALIWDDTCLIIAFCVFFVLVIKLVLNFLFVTVL